MKASFEFLKTQYPHAILQFEVSKFDTFLTHLKKLLREELEEHYKAINDGNNEVYYSFKHVATMLDVSTRTLNRWQSQGYLVPVMIGGQRRYRRSDIEKIISQSSHIGNNNGRLK